MKGNQSVEELISKIQESQNEKDKIEVYLLIHSTIKLTNPNLFNEFELELKYTYPHLYKKIVSLKNSESQHWIFNRSTQKKILLGLFFFISLLFITSNPGSPVSKYRIYFAIIDVILISLILYYKISKKCR